MRYKIEPWAHQRDAIARSLDPEATNFALLWEPGTGKTSATINILRHKFNHAKKVLRTIIFCPPVVIRNWKDEWLAHSSIDPARVVLLTGQGRDRTTKFMNAAYAKGVSGTVPLGCVFVTNYEALQMPALYMAMKAWAPEVVVFDESHKLKNHASKRSKAADGLVNPRMDKTPGKGRHPPPRPYTMILTGTPILQNGMDLYMQYKCLDGGRMLGENFYIFRAKYCVDKNAGMPREKYYPKWEMRPWALDVIATEAKKITSVAKKKDCLDLPPMVYQTIRVGMEPRQAEKYQEMEDDLITYMDANPVSAPLAITRALRLLQITAGYVNDDSGKAHVFKDTPKECALRELLEDITPEHKVIVWAVWKSNYETIRNVCDRVGVPYVELHGDVSEKERQVSIDRFNSNPAYKVLIGHPGSGGIGVNLVSASYSIFYSRTFSLEHTLQAEARNYRGGSNIHDKVTRIDLVCENTIEGDVQKRLAGKLEIGENVLREIAKERIRS